MKNIAAKIKDNLTNDKDGQLVTKCIKQWHNIGFRAFEFLMSSGKLNIFEMVKLLN